MLERGTLWCPLAKAQRSVTRMTLFDAVEPEPDDAEVNDLLVRL